MAQSLLKQEYGDDIKLKNAIGLMLWMMSKMVSKIMDSTILRSKKHE